MIPPYLAGARVSMHLCRAGMITRASPYSMYLYVIYMYSSERFTMFLLILVCSFSGERPVRKKAAPKRDPQQ